MDQLVELKVFCRVAACGSFSQAGRELSLAQSAVSRGVAALEERLRVRLFERTTRRVALTIEGRAYLDLVAEHVRALEDAELRASSGFGDLAGRVRVAAPGALGRVLLMPEIVRLMQEWPGLSVEVAFTDRRVDLAKGEFDLAFRVGAGTEPSFVEREVGRSPQWIVGAPALFARGAPSTLEDLRGLPAVLSGRAIDLAKLGLELRFAADDLDAALAAAIAGLGVSVLPRWIVAPHVARGALTRVLPKSPLPSPPVVVVYPRRLRKVSRQLLERVEAHVATSLDPKT